MYIALFYVAKRSSVVQCTTSVATHSRLASWTRLLLFVFLTKASGTVDTGYRFNWLNAKQGNISNLIYYSQFPWQSFAGTLQNRSTLDTDYIVCDQDEYPLFVEKGVEVFGLEAREIADSQAAALKYNGSPQKAGMAREYKMRYPTESLQLTSTMYYMSNGGERYDGSDIWIR